MSCLFFPGLGYGKKKNHNSDFKNKILKSQLKSFSPTFKSWQKLDKKHFLEVNHLECCLFMMLPRYKILSVKWDCNLSLSSCQRWQQISLPLKRQNLKKKIILLENHASPQYVWGTSKNCYNVTAATWTPIEKWQSIAVVQCEQ